jgi:hypothetical protein
MRAVHVLLWGLAGCTGPGAERTCEEIEADFEAERADLQQCADDLECGQVLEGTSCGCTRDLVARLDADPARFEALVEEGSEESCELGLVSDCDCPQAAGFRCDEGTCAWNYVADWPYLPQCWTERGDSFSLDSAAIDGSELVVTLGFGGGCAEHEFVLCWPDQSFLESYPVQVQLELFHEGHDDACEAWLVEEHRLSLQPLAEAYEAAYGESTGTIFVHVGEFELTWTFGESP